MKLANLPVFPNWFPFNNMIFDGHMKVGPYEGVKTRSWNWGYRGPVLFYNSGRTAHTAARAYGYRDAPTEHKVIIGVGELVDVREFTNEEALQMVCNFNKLSESKVREMVEKAREEWDCPESEVLFGFFDLGDYIAPYRIGFFFKNLAKFHEPVKFNWPAGPVKPINTKITSGSPLARQLQLSGA
ncbi:MAG: hypothetical protein AAB869_01335 [Patescibacteria group bacterium]